MNHSATQGALEETCNRRIQDRAWLYRNVMLGLPTSWLIPKRDMS